MRGCSVPYFEISNMIRGCNPIFNMIHVQRIHGSFKCILSELSKHYYSLTCNCECYITILLMSNAYTIILFWIQWIPCVILPSQGTVTSVLITSLYPMPHHVPCDFALYNARKAIKSVYIENLRIKRCWTNMVCLIKLQYDENITSDYKLNYFAKIIPDDQQTDN